MKLIFAFFLNLTDLFFSIKKESCDCKRWCHYCGVCPHSYTCTCSSSQISKSGCKHFHVLYTLLNCLSETPSQSYDGTEGVVNIRVECPRSGNWCWKAPATSSNWSRTCLTAPWTSFWKNSQKSKILRRWMAKRPLVQHLTCWNVWRRTKNLPSSPDFGQSSGVIAKL